MRPRYKEKADYRADLVEQWDEDPTVPACFEACARFVVTNPQEEDIKQAGGPASSTTAAAEEAEHAANEVDPVKWLSVVEESAGLDLVSES